jgi:hypothetical protein
MARLPRSVAALSAALLTCLVALPVAAVPNALSSPSVTPSSGSTSASFTFRVRYDSGQGNTAPTWVRANLTGLSPINLALVSGTAGHGTYAATTTLPVGTRSVTFSANAPNGVDPLISGGTVTVADDPPTPTPTPTSTLRRTASPTASPRPTPAPTATPTASSPSSAAATPRPTQAPTSVPPTPGGGVLSGTPRATSSPAAPGAPAGSHAAGPSSTPGGSAGASGAAGTPGSDPGGGPQGPDEDGDAGRADRGSIPAAAIWLFVGGAISITGAATLGVLTVRRQSRSRVHAPRAE